MSDTCVPPGLNVGNLVGPFPIGSMFNYGLLGILCLQIYMYSHFFPKDPLINKVLVYGLLVIDLVQTALATHCTWEAVGAGWGNLSALRFTPWSLATIPPLSGVVAFFVELYFARRIYILGMRRWLLPTVISILALAQLVFSLWTGAGIALIDLDVTRVRELDPEVTAWLCTSVVCDALISISLVFLLWRSKNETSKEGGGFEATSSIITRAIRMAIETGLVTTAFAILDLCFFLGSRHTNWHMAIVMCLGKLYSNSVVAILNSRASIFNDRFKSPSTSHNAYVWRGGADLQSGVISAPVVNVTTVRSMHMDDIDIEMDSRKQSMPFQGSVGKV